MENMDNKMLYGENVSFSNSFGMDVFKTVWQGQLENEYAITYFEYEIKLPSLKPDHSTKLLIKKKFLFIEEDDLEKLLVRHSINKIFFLVFLLRFMRQLQEAYTCTKKLTREWTKKIGDTMMCKFSM